MLFEFFILEEIKTNKEVIDEEINNEQLFFDSEKFVLNYTYLLYLLTILFIYSTQLIKFIL